MNKRIQKKIEKKARELMESEEMTLEKAFNIVCQYLIDNGKTFESIKGDCIGYDIKEKVFEYKFQLGGFSSPILYKSDKIFKKKSDL